MASEDIIIRMGMDASAFNRGLQSAKVQGKQFQSSINSIGASIAAVGLGALTAKTVAYAGTISDLSARLGVSASALQELGYAASLSGGSLEDVAAALGKLAIASQAAIEGGQAGEEMEASFARLGVTMQDLRTMRIEDLFRKVGAGVRDAADVQTVLSDATKILGKNSANVLAAMRNDLEAAAEEARRLGLIIGDDIIKKLDDLGDSADTFGKRLMADLASPLTWLMDRIHEIIAFSKIAMVTIAGLGTMVADRFTGGKVKALASFKAMAAEVDRIVGQEAERTRERPTRPPAPIIREEAEQTNAKAVREADQILKLREKIKDSQAEELGIAEQRERIEEQILDLADRQADDNSLFAEASARADEISEMLDELDSQSNIEQAAKVISESSPVDAEGIEAKRKAEAYILELADKRKSTEGQITALKKEQAKANPEEVKALERQQKMLDLKKKEKELAKQQGEARKKFVELRGERGTAVGEADTARGERLKFTLGDLAGANLRNVSDPTLRKDILAAREVSRLESQAGFLKNRGGVGDLAEAAKRLSVADKVRAGISSIRDTERFPFANMDANIASIDETMEALLTQAKTDGLNVQAIMAP